LSPRGTEKGCLDTLVGCAHEGLKDVAKAVLDYLGDLEKIRDGSRAILQYSSLVCVGLHGNLMAMLYVTVIQVLL